MSNCHSCNCVLSPNAKFCVACGEKQDIKKFCPSCKANVKPDQKFCLQCGTSLSNNISSSEGVANLFIQPEYIAKKISMEELSSITGGALLVPAASVGVIIKSGVVKYVLAPGKKMSRSWTEKLLNVLKLGSSSEFFLIDSRPLSFSVPPIDANFSDGNRKLSVRVEVNVDYKDKIKLIAFLSAVSTSGGFISARSLSDQLLMLTQKVAKELIGKESLSKKLSLESLSDNVEKAVSVNARNKFGLTVNVSLGLGNTKFSDNLEFGNDVSVSVANCSSCDTELSANQKFCTTCGKKSNVTETEEKNDVILTKDGKVVKLSINLSYEADQEHPYTFDKTSYQNLCRDTVSAYTFEELSQPSNLSSISDKLFLQFKLLSVPKGVLLKELTLLDIKDPNAGWLYGLEAELERAKKEAYVGREWLLQEESELDIQALAQDIAVKRKVSELQFQFDKDAAVLNDREARQSQLERESSLDVADSQRNASRDIDISGIERNVKNTKARANREDDNEQLLHDMNNEHKVVDHDISLARKGMDFDSDKLKQQVENDSLKARSENEVKLELERQRQALQIEKLQAMSKLDDQISERELQGQKQEHDHHQSMRQSLKGLSAVEMLAAQATELGNAEDGGGVASAIASALQSEQVNNVQQELYERMLAEKNNDADRQQELVNSALSIQQNTQQKVTNAYKEAAVQAKDMSERSMESMSNVAASAAKQPNTIHNKAQIKKEPVTSKKQVHRPTELQEDEGIETACPECNNALLADATFCGECGYRM